MRDWLFLALLYTISIRTGSIPRAVLWLRGDCSLQIGFVGEFQLFLLSRFLVRDRNYTRLVSGGAIWPRRPDALHVNPLSRDMDEVLWSLPRMHNGAPCLPPN